VLPGDPLVKDIMYGLLSLGATSVPGETSVNMEILEKTISQFAGWIDTYRLNFNYCQALKNIANIRSYRNGERAFVIFCRAP